VVMLLGFGIIAITNGILTVSGMNHHRQLLLISFHKRGDNKHSLEEIFCHKCGEVLRQE
tara:strand:+ start:315 stop:491 length:177 start_codon:yes stop_codon:yes gene_type:complete